MTVRGPYDHRSILSSAVFEKKRQVVVIALSASWSSSCKTLTFSNISVFAEDIYLKFRLVVYY